jgi:hypothetical protein
LPDHFSFILHGALVGAGSSWPSRRWPIKGEGIGRGVHCWFTLPPSLVVQQWIRTNRRKTVDIEIKDMNPTIKKKKANESTSRLNQPKEKTKANNQ